MEHVLVIKNGESVMIKTQSYDNEEELQEIIKRSPNLINLSSIFDSPMLVIGREVERIDVLRLTTGGVPIIIECKRRENPDMRAIIAQVFEYAAKLNQMTYDEFNDMARRYFLSPRCEEPQYKNLNVAEAVLEFRKTLDENEDVSDEIDKPKMVQMISENLEKGEFYLLIVVDRISDIALQTIKFLNSKLERLRLEIIEVSKFKNEERQIFVPKHVNPVPKTTVRGVKARPGKIAFQDMLKNCETEEQVQYIEKFRELWENEPEFSIDMGTAGFSAKFDGVPVLWGFVDKIQLRTRKSFSDIHNNLVELLQRHFTDRTEVTAKLTQQEFRRLDSLETFIQDVQSLVKTQK